jgi:competence protein ComEC
VLLAVAGVAGGAAPEAPLPALAALVGWLVLAPPRRLGLFLVFAFFLVTGARALAELEGFGGAYQRAAAALGGPRRCAGRVTVTTSPTERTERAGPPAEPRAVLTYTAEAPSLDCEGRPLGGPLLLRLSGGPADLARGDELEVVAQLAPVQLFRNAALPSPVSGAARRGVLLGGAALSTSRVVRAGGLVAWIDRTRARTRARIAATYRPLVAPLGRALVLGESDLDEQDAVAFQKSGLVHLLAVSGTHLVIAVLSLTRALRALLVRVGPLARRWDTPRLAAALGALFSLLYADFAGGSGSAWRAALMLCLICGGRALGLRVSGATALGGSLVLGILLDPLAGTDLSFLLSALATSGLLGLGQPVSRLLCRGVFVRTPLRQLTESLVATLASTLPCAPLLALMDGQLTAAALLANVIAAPLGELIALPACLLHVVAAPLPALEQGLALLGSGALVGVRAVALTSASASALRFGVPLPTAWQVTGCVLVGVGALRALPELGRFARHPRLRLAGSVLALLGVLAAGRRCANSRQAPRGQLGVTALDVGQGDALVLDLPDSSLALIDGGGAVLGRPDTAARVLLPYLRARGRRAVDLLVLTHPHPDHLLGLVGVAEALPVRELWHSVEPRPGGEHARLVAAVRARGGQVRGPAELCGERHFGGAAIEVLWPCAVEQSGVRLEGNDVSLVLRVTLGARRALLVGDAEHPVEHALLARDPAKLRADLLKVGHHGSETSSSPAFLAAVGPAAALVSVGVRNDFRHPRPATLVALSAVGAEVLRTDRLGSVSWRTDGRQVWLRAAGPLPGAPP